jgi:16S rRNA (cytosine967-C5)-methyltransferase
MKDPQTVKPKPASKPKPNAVISPARKAAFAVLSAVERGQSHSDDLLRDKTIDALTPADRNLATALVLGVLRWQIRLDHQVQALLQRPNAKLDRDILIALRLGAFQILHMDRIPARAAIDESVELAKQAGHRYASGMVNAVLRKLALAPVKATEDAEDPFRMKGAGYSPNKSLAPPQVAHPAWMVERWTNFFGLDATHAICHHGQSQPALTIRIANPSVEVELVAAGIGLEASELLTAARTVVSGDVTATAAFLEGRIRIQDEGSQLVAEIASNDFGQEKKTILDACAAPGGKTLILAERVPNAHILACELSPPRLEQLQKRLAVLGERVECRLADATGLTEEAVFDLALTDVPCSGTGTLGRNPEIRHRLRLEDLARQAERQRAILAAALRAIRPGGRVVYSTCSLEPEENEQVIAAVLAAFSGARLCSLESRLKSLREEGFLTAFGAEQLRDSLTPEGALRLLPGKFHTDGFFIAMIERIS